jgi:3-oxoadipate enol-lactonase
VIPHHIVSGPADAPVLVLANSLGATLEMWDGQARQLAERFRLIRFDARGHGRSEVPPGPYAIDDFGRDVVELLDHLDVERASVAGISLGGMTALWLGINAPERVEKLVPTCTSAKLGPPEMWRDRAAAVREKGTGAIAPAVVQRWVTDAQADRRPKLQEMLASMPDDGYAASCEAIEHMDLIPRLHEITAPTLVISARQDQATPPEHGERIAAAIRGARFEVLDGAAHLANLERGDAVVRLITEHLEA